MTMAIGEGRRRRKKEEEEAKAKAASKTLLHPKRSCFRDNVAA
jgi:hypothetical protein